MERKEELASRIQMFFPQITISDFEFSREEIHNIIKFQKLQLLFIDASIPDLNYNILLSDLFKEKCEVILITKANNSDNKYCTHFGVSGLIYLPINTANIVVTIRTILQKINLLNSKLFVKEIEKASATENIVGIPTLSGIEYINTRNIIRCEGLQKCSRVITVDRKNIISSYSIGNFSELLKPYGFELVHRSHLINLAKVIRYSREGFIYLTDNSRVPLARRKKTEFLGLWSCL
ncbi:LytR/AlgR family response regulator transcription factor [Christiangramia crocea]|nr:LytTR family DNA-binding domain-containing protein [Gramella crocea]